MRIAVFGAGAIGGHLAARLSLAGCDVVVFARGAHGEAIASRGLIVRDEAGEHHAKGVRLARTAAEAGPVDLVMITTKAHHQGDAARAIAPLIGDGQSVVFISNGIPWWYGAGIDLPGVKRADDPALRVLDPDGDISRHVPLANVVGAAIYAPGRIAEPGVIQCGARGNELWLGTPDETQSHRLEPLIAALKGAGIGAKTDLSIRQYIWIKMHTTLCMAPTSALTGQTYGEIYEDEGMLELIKAIEAEGLAVADAHGFHLEPFKGLPAGGVVPGHKNSMLQDVERGARVEFEPIVEVPRLYARAAGLPCPTLDTVATLLKAKLKSARLL
jgi:2-dehydropantoate 2-reductase